MQTKVLVLGDDGSFRVTWSLHNISNHTFITTFIYLHRYKTLFLTRILVQSPYKAPCLGGGITAGIILPDGLEVNRGDATGRIVAASGRFALLLGFTL